MGPSSHFSLENAPGPHGPMDVAIFLKPLPHFWRRFKRELFPGRVPGEL